MNDYLDNPFDAYGIMDALAKATGFRGVNPEFLESLSRYADNNSWDCITSVPYGGKAIRRAYFKVMADMRAMFAPA
jgi:hypothetical protein